MTAALNISETGRAAYRAGLKPSDNPFTIGSQARSLWATGYRAEREKLAAESRPPSPTALRLTRSTRQ